MLYVVKDTVIAGFGIFMSIRKNIQYNHIIISFADAQYNMSALFVVIKSECIYLAVALFYKSTSVAPFQSSATVETPLQTMWQHVSITRQCKLLGAQRL